MWYPGSGVVLDCIVSGLCCLSYLYSHVYSLIDMLKLANYSEMISHLNICYRVAEEEI